MSFIGDIFGASMQSDATENAAQTQADASRYATDVGNKQFEQVRQDNAPMLEARNQSLAKLRQVLGIDGGNGLSAQTVMNDPGYQFGLSEGQRALDHQATARGMRNSGAQLKAAARYGNDYATGKYDAAFNRIVNPLQSMAGLGQSVVNSTNQLGQQNAMNAGSNAMQAANASAAGQLASARGWANAGNAAAGWFASNNPFASPSGGSFGPQLDPFFTGTGGSGD